MYEKIIKWSMLALLLLSAAIVILGYALGFEENDGTMVDTLFYWTYLMIGIAIGAAVVVNVIVNAINEPKSLIKTGLVILGCVVVVALAYFTASGSPVDGQWTVEPSYETLKFTDMILNLTYFLFGVAILSIIGGFIYNAIRK